MSSPHVLPRPAAAASEPWIDWGKAIASQLIVWHHLVSYGPLAPRLRPLLPTLFEWLGTRAALAVQLFLVTSGYLAARSLWPAPGEPRVRLAQWPARVGQRWRRLMPVYLLALALAVAGAALARQLMASPDTPEAPTLAQGVAHLLMLQDIAHVPALSTGVWYIAIDLQLFALLAALAAVLSLGLPKGRGQGGPVLAAHGVLMLCVLALAAVCVFNLHPQDAVWGIYFFGSFTLGVLAAWGRRGEARWAFTALILGIATAGLMLAWRDRLALACMVALLLLWQPARGWLARSRVQPTVAALAAWSYAVFMVHYPVSLMVNGAFERWLPHDPGNALLGLLLTWVLSIALGAQAHRLLERRPARAAAQPLPAGTALAPPHGR